MTGANRRQFIQGGALAAVGATAARGYENLGHFMVDCQSHCFVPELVEMMAKRKEPPYSYRKEGRTYVVTGLAAKTSRIASCATTTWMSTRSSQTWTRPGSG